MFYVAIAAGILFCSFWILQLVFVALHRRWTNKLVESGPLDAETGVTVIHPIKDLDFELDINMESWLNQNYTGPVQHIFSFQDPDDPAIPVIKSLIEKYPDKDMQITVNPVMEGLNGKSSNMVNGMKLAKYEIVMFGDSDIRIKPDFFVKMIRPLKDPKVGIMTCGQINIGGKDFWTRFFTFLQNGETDFIWALLTKMGIDVGATGAAFAMRKSVLEEVGGLEAFGDSLLEDLHLGNTLYKKGYKLIVGPFLECHVNKLAMEKSLNYAKRIAVGIKAHIAVELPQFFIMLFWYWLLLILSIIFMDMRAAYLSMFYVILRMLHGVAMRIVTGNKVMLMDFIMGPFFDLFGTFYLTYSVNNPYVMWRGIRYEVKKGGYIDEQIESEENIEENI